MKRFATTKDVYSLRKMAHSVILFHQLIVAIVIEMGFINLHSAQLSLYYTCSKVSFSAASLRI